MNPVQSSAASTVTSLLASQITIATKVLPPAHLSTPVHGESFKTPDEALRRLQDWAFTQGFAVVTESKRKGRCIFHCIHHKKKTRNSRKTVTEDRKRLGTAIMAKGCTWSVYVSQRAATQDAWILGWTHEDHSHTPNPDPFTFAAHKAKKPGYREAVDKALVHRGAASYSTSSRLLRKEGLPVLTAKEYYNLCRKADTGGKLTNQQEIQVITKYLEDQDFHVQVQYEHLLDEQGERTDRRVVRDIFFISDAQICLGRRFVSDFLYETDATFNTNELRLPLSVMVGITNTGKTFPLAYCYITSESAKSFDFVAGELTKYVFYDCPEAAVICADFTKGLGASIAAQALRDAGEEDETVQQRHLEAGELPDVGTLQLGSGEEETILQLCEWHAAKAIQRRLVHAGKYSKERREELTDLVNAWIRASTEDNVKKTREVLVKALEPAERKYLIDYYQPKEKQFLRYWTRTYRNLGAHSTQRNEAQHVVVKVPLTKHLQLHKAVEHLVQDLEPLLSVHYNLVNRQRNFRPRLLDLDAFSEVGDLLTHYCLNLMMTEWSNTKIIGLAIEAGKEEAFNFDPENPKCPLACELPLRYSLPCKHWMYPAFVYGCQLPLSLFHPRWLFDGPAVLHNRWHMSWKTGEDALGVPSSARGPDLSRSRFHGRGEEMVKGAAMETVLLLRQCPPSIAENFAVAVRDMNAVLLEKQQQLLARAEKAPLELPPPLPQPNARDFPISRKRKMTGLEAALQEERDAIVRRQREIRQTEEDKDFRQQYHEEAIVRILARHSQQQQSSAPPFPSPSSSLSAPPPLLNPPLSSMSSPSSSNNDNNIDSDSDSGHKDAAETIEALRPRRGVRRTQKLVDNSQTAKELAASKGWKGKGPMRRKSGKKAEAAAAEMSQLLDGYQPPPSSAALLEK